MKNKLLPYPEPIRIRSGCRVSWHYYGTRKEAKKCAKAALHNAEIREALGFDFGFQVPGSITETKPGEFEVCIP